MTDPANLAPPDQPPAISEADYQALPPNEQAGFVAHVTRWEEVRAKVKYEVPAEVVYYRSTGDELGDYVLGTFGPGHEDYAERLRDVRERLDTHSGQPVVALEAGVNREGNVRCELAMNIFGRMMPLGNRRGEMVLEQSQGGYEVAQIDTAGNHAHGVKTVPGQFLVGGRLVFAGGSNDWDKVVDPEMPRGSRIVIIGYDEIDNWLQAHKDLPGQPYTRIYNALAAEYTEATRWGIRSYPIMRKGVADALKGRVIQRQVERGLPISLPFNNDIPAPVNLNQK